MGTCHRLPCRLIALCARITIIAVRLPVAPKNKDSNRLGGRTWYLPDDRVRHVDGSFCREVTLNVWTREWAP